MSITKPGFDTHYIIQKAMNSKSLATLSKEEDEYQARLNGTKPEISYKEIKTPFDKPVYNKQTIQEIKEYCKDKTPDEILEAMGIKVYYGTKGEKYLSHYKWPNVAYSFKAAEIDEEKLIEGVTGILGNCDLTGSYLKSLGEISTIGGNLTIPLYSKLEDLSSLKSVYFVDCNAENPEDVMAVFKKLHFSPENITCFSKNSALNSIMANVYFNPAVSEALNSMMAEKTYS